MYSIGKIGVLMPEIADPMHEAGLPVSVSSIFYGEFWKGIPKKIAEQIAEGYSDRMLHVQPVCIIAAALQNGFRLH